VDLTLILRGCAVVAGLLGGFGAKFRTSGTRLADLGVGIVVALLFVIVALVVMVLAIGLDVFGAVHLAYLVLVIGIPIASAIIVVPHLLDREFRTPFMAWLLLFLSLGLVGVGLWGSFVEPTRLKVDEQALNVSTDELLIVGVLADVHGRSVGDYEREAVDRLLAAEPDIVVIPGDLYQIPDEDLDATIPEFVGLVREIRRAVDTVVLVNGHTDHIDVLEDIAESTGALLLDDQIAELNVNGQNLAIVGLTTPLDDEDSDKDESAVDVTVLETLEASYDEEDLVLVVSHKPDPVLDLPEDAPVDLFIAGHTHGGQVSLPWVGPPMTFSELPQTVAAGGLHLVDGFPVYVSTGVGIERGQAPQFRFRVRPSIGVIMLVPSN
jgi:predicted MPP superfamily phosphohydrolase